MEEAFSVLKVLEVCGGRLFLWPGSYSGPSDLRKISWSRHVFLADLLAERKLLGDGLHLDTFYLSDHRILKRPGKVCLNLVAEAYSDIPQRKKLLVVGTNSGAEALSDIPHKKSFLKVGTNSAPEALSDILQKKSFLKVGTNSGTQAL